MTALATVAAVLDAMAAWAADEARFCQGWFGDDAGRRCAEGELSRLAFGRATALRRPYPPPFDRAHERLTAAAIGLGYESVACCNDRGGLPAVRAMIARAREGASGGDGR